MVLQSLGERPDCRRQDAAEVGVALGKSEPRSTGGRRGPDRQVLALGKRYRGMPAAAGVDVRTCDEDRTAGAVEPLSELPNLLGLGHSAPANRAPDRLAGSELIDLSPPIIHRHRDEDGTPRRQPGEVGSTRQSEGNVLGPRCPHKTT